MKFVWWAIFAYIVIFGLIVSLRHYDFQTQTWDLAAFVQSFWNASHGGGLVNSLEQVPNHLGLHFSPWLLLLVPGYALFNSPYFLLIIQTITLALGAWPLYLLSRRVLISIPLSRVIVAAYLLFPGLQWANIYDFHEITFFVPLLIAALYFIEVRKWIPAAIFLALSASVKEDAILVVLFVGVYLLFRTANSKLEARNPKRFGLAVILISLVYFILAVKVFMPALGGGVLRFDRYANLGENPTAIVKNVAANPLLLAQTILTKEKFVYLFWLFLPVLFLPFFSWRSLILLFPGLAENLLTNYQFQFSGLYHYDSILIPGIFVGAVYGLQKVITRWPDKEKIIQWTFLGVAVLAFLLRSPIGVFSFPIEYFKPNSQWEAYRQLVKLVPPDLSVAANTNLVPHLAHRQFIYTVGIENGFVDMVIIDGADIFPFKSQEEMQAYIDEHLKTGAYRASLFEDRYLILLNNKYRLSSEPQKQDF